MSCEQKNETIKFRLTSKEKEQINTLAREANMSVSQYLLNCALYGNQVNPLQTKTTEKFMNHLENARNILDDPCFNGANKAIVERIDEEVLYLWHFANMSQQNI